MHPPAPWNDMFPDMCLENSLLILYQGHFRVHVKFVKYEMEWSTCILCNIACNSESLFWYGVEFHNETPDLVEWVYLLWITDIDRHRRLECEIWLGAERAEMRGVGDQKTKQTISDERQWSGEGWCMPGCQPVPLFVWVIRYHLYCWSLQKKKECVL